MTKGSKSGEESRHCKTRREVLGAAGRGLVYAASSCLGMGLTGCVTVKRHIFQAGVGGKSLLLPASEMAKLQALTDVLEIRSIQQEDPVLIRKLQGRFVALSSTCTHRGCEVESNPSFYECPCHSSRFDLQGKVLNGPATQDLDRLTLEQTARGWELKF